VYGRSGLRRWCKKRRSLLRGLSRSGRGALRCHHTYGYPESGTAESVKAISHDDLLHFWQQNYSPNDAALIVSGNIKLATLKPLLEKAFGEWKAARLPRRRWDGGSTEARLILVDRPGAPQSTLLCFSTGVARSTPDYAAIEVMNTELGGLFSAGST